MLYNIIDLSQHTKISGDYGIHHHQQRAKDGHDDPIANTSCLCNTRATISRSGNKRERLQ